MMTQTAHSRHFRHFKKLPIPRLAAVLFLATIFLRLLVASTLWMTDDEAWYWALSQSGKLDWAYVVHPPMDAWLTALGTRIFGNGIFGARAIGFLCTSLGSYGLLRLALKMGLGKSSFVVALFCLVGPLFFLGGILNGPDLPLFLFWILIFDTTFDLTLGKKSAEPYLWIKLGIVTGLGLLSKYTAAVAGLSALVCLLLEPATRKKFETPWPYVALLLCVLVFSPVIFWNASHDWASFRFQFLDRHSNSDFSFRRWGLFWVSQFFLFGPAIFFGWFLLVRTILKKNPLENFLAIWAVVPAAIFFVQPLFSPFKIHWALFAFVPVLFFLALLWSKGHQRLVRFGAWFSGSLTIIGMTTFYLPVVPNVVTLVSKQKFDPKFDISNDVYGWPEFRTEWKSISNGLPLLTSRYQLASQAAFAFGDPSEVLLVPQNSYENRDWGGPKTPPDEFLYLMDNRYQDNPQDRYLGFTCNPYWQRDYFRGRFLAKTIFLERCVKNK